MDELRGLWRALDVDFSGLVDVAVIALHEDHGPQMHQLTEYSKQMRGLESRATTPSVATKEKKPKLRRSPASTTNLNKRSAILEDQTKPRRAARR